MTQTWDEADALEFVRKSVLRELPPGVLLPSDEDDLVVTGLIDSMGWVGILTAIEQAAGIRKFSNPWPEGRPQSIRALAEIVGESRGPASEERPKETPFLKTRSESPVSMKGWGYSLGSVMVEAEQVERELGLPLHTIRDRAGIQSVRRVADSEDEISLAQKAAGSALEIAQADFEDINFIVATSATYLNLPSLAASLHSRLLLPEMSGTLDVGGACVGLIHALAVAKGLLQTNRGRLALVVASEVNSRRLASPQVPPEFRGLFGDGACAFVLGRSDEAAGAGPLKLGDFLWGCSGSSASSLRLSLDERAGIAVQFKGEQLAQAAVTQLDRIVAALENLSGKSRAEVDCFVLHEPNPRIVEILAQRANIPLARIPRVSLTCGNLGSATCGISLCEALTRLHDSSPSPLIFIAAVAPGLIWAGTTLS